MCLTSPTPGLCSALFSLWLPCPVCTRFICLVLCPSPQTPGFYSVFNFPSAPLPSLHTFLFVMFVCFASQTPGLCSAFNLPSAPLPSLHTFLFVMFVCFASQTPGLCSAFNLPSAPLPSLHTFYLSYFVCFASLSPILCSASLFSSPRPSFKFVHFISVFHPQNSAVLFSLGFLFAYAIIGFYSGFVVFLLCSPSFAFPRCIHSDPCPSILYALSVLFFFYAL